MIGNPSICVFVYWSVKELYLKYVFPLHLPNKSVFKSTPLAEISPSVIHQTLLRL